MKSPFSNFHSFLQILLIWFNFTLLLKERKPLLWLSSQLYSLVQLSSQHHKDKIALNFKKTHAFSLIKNFKHD